uniref:AAA domain protein n=1 Tax=Neospora caninum (strain Liverpool) TaxID=572307 RepID=A0A0F7U7Y8_NEOCL|nr:TPA: hypothetical protein BN1204_010570 [Neospora caninum Liverpool]
MEPHSSCWFECTYTSQKTKKNKSWKDGVCTCQVMRGFLRFLLYAAEEETTPTGDTQLRKKGDALDSHEIPLRPFEALLDEDVEFPLHLVQLTRVLPPRSTRPQPSSSPSGQLSQSPCVSRTGNARRFPSSCASSVSSSSFPSSASSLAPHGASLSISSSSQGNTGKTNAQRVPRPARFRGRGGLFSSRVRVAAGVSPADLRSCASSPPSAFSSSLPSHSVTEKPFAADSASETRLSDPYVSRSAAVAAGSFRRSVESLECTDTPSSLSHEQPPSVESARKAFVSPFAPRWREASSHLSSSASGPFPRHEREPSQAVMCQDTSSDNLPPCETLSASSLRPGQFSSQSQPQLISANYSGKENAVQAAVSTAYPSANARFRHEDVPSPGTVAAKGAVLGHTQRPGDPVGPKTESGGAGEESGRIQENDAKLIRGDNDASVASRTIVEDVGRRGSDEDGEDRSCAARTELVTSFLTRVAAENLLEDMARDACPWIQHCPSLASSVVPACFSSPECSPGGNRPSRGSKQCEGEAECRAMEDSLQGEEEYGGFKDALLFLSLFESHGAAYPFDDKPHVVPPGEDALPMDKAQEKAPRRRHPMPPAMLHSLLSSCVSSSSSASSPPVPSSVPFPSSASAHCDTEPAEMDEDLVDLLHAPANVALQPEREGGRGAFPRAHLPAAEPSPAESARSATTKREETTGGEEVQVGKRVDPSRGRHPMWPRPGDGSESARERYRDVLGDSERGRASDTQTCAFPGSKRQAFRPLSGARGKRHLTNANFHCSSGASVDVDLLEGSTDFASASSSHWSSLRRGRPRSFLANKRRPTERDEGAKTEGTQEKANLLPLSRSRRPVFSPPFAKGAASSYPGSCGNPPRAARPALSPAPRASSRSSFVPFQSLNPAAGDFPDDLSSQPQQEETEWLPTFRPLAAFPARREQASQLLSLLPLRFAIPRDPRKVAPAIVRQCMRGVSCGSSLWRSTAKRAQQIESYCLSLFNSVALQIHGTLVELAAALQPVVYGSSAPISPPSVASSSASLASRERSSLSGNAVLVASGIRLQVWASSPCRDGAVASAKERLGLKKQQQMQQRKWRASLEKARQAKRRKRQDRARRGNIESQEDDLEEEDEQDADTPALDQTAEDEAGEDAVEETKTRYFLDFSNCSVQTPFLRDSDRVPPSSHLASRGVCLASPHSSSVPDPLAILQKTVSRGDLWAIAADDDWTHPSKVLLCRSCWKGLHPRSGTVEVEVLRLASSLAPSRSSERSQSTWHRAPRPASLSEGFLPSWWARLLSEKRAERGRDSARKLHLSGMLLGNFANEFAAVDGIERLWKATQRDKAAAPGNPSASARDAERLHAPSAGSSAERGDSELSCLSHALLAGGCPEAKDELRPDGEVAEGDESEDVPPLLEPIPLNLSSREAEQILRDAIAPNTRRRHKLNDEQQAVLLAISRWFVYKNGKRPFQFLLRREKGERNGEDKRRDLAPKRSCREARREKQRRRGDADAKGRRTHDLGNGRNGPAEGSDAEEAKDGTEDEEDEEDEDGHDERRAASDALGAQSDSVGAECTNARDLPAGEEEDWDSLLFSGGDVQDPSEAPRQESSFLICQEASDSSGAQAEERRPTKSEETAKRGKELARIGRPSGEDPSNDHSSSSYSSSSSHASSSSREASRERECPRRGEASGEEAARVTKGEEAAMRVYEDRTSASRHWKTKRTKRRNRSFGEDDARDRDGLRGRREKRRNERNDGEEEDFEKALHLLQCDRQRTNAPPILLVHGVFGAGKSSLLAASLATLSRLLEAAKNRSHILLICMTNAALDSVLLKLRFECQYTDFVRIGRLSETHPLLLPHAVSSSKDRALAIQEWRRLLHKFLVNDAKQPPNQPASQASSYSPSVSPSTAENIEVSTAHAREEDASSMSDMAASLLARIDEGTFPPTMPQWKRVRLFAATCSAAGCSDVFLSSVAPSGATSGGLATPFVFLDEATQAPESLVVSILSRFSAQRLLQVGDSKQLPPVVKVPGAPFSCSLFSRLLPVYLASARRLSATRRGPESQASVAPAPQTVAKKEGEKQWEKHLSPIAKRNASASDALRGYGAEDVADAASRSASRSAARGRDTASFFSAVLLLRTQYRCHPVIARLCSRMFYGENYVKNGVSGAERLPPGPSSFGGPLCCISVRGSLESREGKSFVNWREAFVVATILRTVLEKSFIFETNTQTAKTPQATLSVSSLAYPAGASLSPHSSVDSPLSSSSSSSSLSSSSSSSSLSSSSSSSLSSVSSLSCASSLEFFTKRPLRPSEVGVICLYRSQVSCVERALKKVLPAAVVKAIQISTVDAFQGGEKELILLSCVRTTASFLDRNSERDKTSFRHAGERRGPGMAANPAIRDGEERGRPRPHAEPAPSAALSGDRENGNPSHGAETAAAARQTEDERQISRALTEEGQPRDARGEKTQQDCATRDAGDALRLLKEDAPEEDGDPGKSDKGKDFINCQKRMNVAFSRARRQLVIVSHDALFQSHPAWRELWQSSTKLFL